MSQSIAEELARVPMSPNLMATLTRAADYARQQGHGRVTLEHMLLALTEDSDAALVLQASQVAAEPLNADVTTHLASLEPTGGEGQIGIAPELKRVLEAAAAAAQQGKRQVNGAIVLAAIVGEGKSTAAQMLRAQGLTFEHAIKALQRANRPQAAKPMPAAGPSLPTPGPNPAAPHATPVSVQPASPAANARPDEPEPATATASPPQPRPQSPEAAAPRTAPPPLHPPAPPPAPPQMPAAAAPPLPTYETEPAPNGSSGSRTQPDWVPADLDPGVAGTAPTPPPRPQSPSAYQPATRATPQPPMTPAPAPMPEPPPHMSASAVMEPSWQPAPLPREAAPHAPAMRQPPRNPPPEPSLHERASEPPSDAGPSTYYQQPADAPYAQPSPYGQGHGHHPAVEAPWQPPDLPRGRPHEPQHAPYPPQPVPSYPPSQGYGAPDPHEDYRQGDGPRRGPPLPALVDARRDGSPPAASGQLIENIPRTMRVDVPVTVEVRLVGTGDAHDQLSHATRAMSVRLAASDGGYTVESLTPETQWIEGGPLPEGQAVARWRWMVVPQRSGRRNLQLAVSTRWIGADGISGDIPMPAQQVTVSVRRRYGKSLGRILGWLLAAGIGAGAALFGGGVWTLLLALAKPWIGG